MVTERKLRANRRNAKRSTGPKDTRSTRYNAQKHGLLSKAAIIQTGDAKEDPDELAALLKALREDFEPDGAMEEILVDRIASCVWRLRRAQQAEVGEIHCAVEIMQITRPVGGAERELVELSQNLPHENALAKILRYETAIERQMYRALKELRDLQACRLGSAIRSRGIVAVDESE